MSSTFFRRCMSSGPISISRDTRQNLCDLRYPAEWFPAARQLRRKLILHVGPTNSGKTYNALQRLQEAGSGVFAGPLRLLAHEVWTKLNALGKPCHLVTGEEVRLVQDAKLTSSTLEMLNLQHRVEVAVIDEIQMIADTSRGFAWTAAVLGVQADEVHLCGEERAIDIIRRIARETDDIVEVNTYKRLSSLNVAGKSLMGDYKALRPGDAYVSFSRTGIFEAKREIQKATGCGVAMAYGALPPETRASQAAHFNDPHSIYNILVASDAIGMGLNLKIKRIVFDALHKSNGKTQEPLSISQIKQIAGRAGRFDHAVKKQLPGTVTCMQEKDMARLRSVLSMETPKIDKAGLQAPLVVLQDLTGKLPARTKFAQVLQTVGDSAMTSSNYFLCGQEARIKLANLIEDVSGLSLDLRYSLLNSPVNHRNPKTSAVFVQVAEHLGRGDVCWVDDIIVHNGLDRALEEVTYAIRHTGKGKLARASNPFIRPFNLADLETLHKVIIHYLWLSYRFRAYFPGMERAIELKVLTEAAIERCLEETASRRANKTARLSISSTEPRLMPEAVGEQHARPP